ncbi:MAG: GerMN domain-containing protein [Bacillota bacterium]
MRSRTNRRIIVSVILVVVVATAVAAGGCGFVSAGKASALQARVNDLENQVADLSAKNKALQAALDQLTRPVTLYFIKNTTTEMYLTRVQRLVAKTGDPLTQAMEELIKGPEAGAGLNPVLPADTRVLSVTVKNGIAYVDFSPEVRRLNVGAQGEALALAAIADTLTEFPEVKQVQILVQGKVIETLAGHFATDRPLPRNETVVK